MKKYLEIGGVFIIGLLILISCNIGKKRKEIILNNNQEYIEQTAKMRVNEDLHKKTREILIDNIAEINMLTDIASDNNLSFETRKKEALELIEKYYIYESVLQGDSILTDVLKVITTELVKSISKSIIEQDSIRLLEKKSEELELKKLEAKILKNHK